VSALAWVAGHRLDLADFEAWAQRLLDWYGPSSLRVVWHARTTAYAKNSVGFEVLGESMLASVRAWESGEWEVDIADEAAPRSRLSGYDPAHSSADLIGKVAAQLRDSGLPVPS
jgi:hypothetical protein